MLILACLPIGDARDASAHLIEAIGQVQYVAAEDSRKFARLCQELNIKHHAKGISFFEGNESEKIDELTNLLSRKKISWSLLMLAHLVFQIQATD